MSEAGKSSSNASSTAATTTTAGTNNGSDWRSDVLQSYRNNEVRDIAKILASIEGESTSIASKMMLSMKFEDQIFKSANSLEDYKKKIAKRLKKLQKAYAQQKQNEKTTATSTTTTTTTTNVTPGTTAVDLAKVSSIEEQQRQELLLELRQKYSDTILYVIHHAPVAIIDMERKLGHEKVEQFTPHIASCKVWARELGIWEENETKEEVKESESKIETQNNSTKPVEDSKKTKKKKDSKFELPSLSQLQRLEEHLKKRAETIRSYVLKHADPDLFLLETLERKDKEIASNPRASKLVSLYLSKRLQLLQQQQQQSSNSTVPSSPSSSTHRNPSIAASTATTTSSSNTSRVLDPIQSLRQALDKARASVPPQTRNDDPKQIEASLKHLDKLRAASTSLMHYYTIQQQQQHYSSVPGRGDTIATSSVTPLPTDTLKKVYDVMMDSTKYVSNALQTTVSKRKERRDVGKDNGQQQQQPENDDDSTSSVTLSDAWTKRMPLPTRVVVEDDDDDEATDHDKSLASNSPPPPSKRRRVEKHHQQKQQQRQEQQRRYPPYYKARLLLQPNRKAAPMNLLLALRRKGVRLCRRATTAGNSCGTYYLELDFGKAFTMTIYLSPLSVHIRAIPDDYNAEDDDHKNPYLGGFGMYTMDDPILGTETLDAAAMIWKPLSYGLISSTTTTSSTPTTRVTAVTSSSSTTDSPGMQSVGGVPAAAVATTTSGSATTPNDITTMKMRNIGLLHHVLEERLRDASTYSTYVLRTCFQHHVKDKTMDFEVEILEGSALLEFLNLARETYMPSWQDYDY